MLHLQGSICPSCLCLVCRSWCPAIHQECWWSSPLLNTFCCIVNCKNLEWRNTRNSIALILSVAWLLLATYAWSKILTIRYARSAVIHTAGHQQGLVGDAQLEWKARKLWALRTGTGKMTTQQEVQLTTDLFKCSNNDHIYKRCLFEKNNFLETCLITIVLR